MMSLQLQPISRKEAHAFIRRHHRHHQPDQGDKFCVAVNDGEKVVGVIVVGIPRARHLNDGWTAEATRICTDGTRNAVSKLWSGARRACQGMGYHKLITYNLLSDDGASMRACGLREVGLRGGGGWNRPSRPRVDTHPTEQKVLWEDDL